jgi:hypothetical protein
MKRLMLASALMLAAGPVNADGLYWVAGNNATRKCDIVTSNPVIGGPSADNGGGYWFGDGPYRSRDDAKLARSTIAACPKPDDDEKEASGNGK